ncbi:AGAP005120-PA [Anopheles gambiae str. PEST]|uniref:AGAP005120-PA n=1 Tax=Anopheles gambiae TaxID=7165 RepID=Q7Q9P6_ANOGA|nr:AGAP005120-PA [Anopheles gambiae str. PEST]
MRKYQQLALVLLSVTCVVILLVYKSENNRLKYVLEVVNIFGRNDAASLIRIDNSTRLHSSPYDFDSPLPAWQRLGDGFYVYSSFWQKNELSAGGTVISIAVGLEHAAVNFKCQIQHGTGDVATGKLHFVRLDHPTGSIKAPNSEVFVVYKLLCKVARDFGQPTEVIYTDTAQSIKRYVPLRVLESRSVQQKMTMTACVDMTDYLELEEEFRMPSAVLQYFLHHQIVGVEDFIVYNSNALNGATASLLYSHGIKINLLPYNFPFDLADRHQNRLLIEMDCLMRNYNAAKLTYIGAINEYLYPSSRLRVNNQFLKYAWKVSSDVSRFSIASRSVCIDKRKKIFSDNLLYDVDVAMTNPTERPFQVYKPQDYNRTAGTPDFVKTLDVDRSLLFVHRYGGKCSSKTNLHDWTVSLQPDFLQYVTDVGRELNKLIFR